MRYMILAAATGLAALTSASPSLAQRTAARGAATVASAPVAGVTSDDRPTGFMLGVHSVGVPGLAIGGADGQNGAFNTTFGAGAGVTAGWAFNHTFSSFATLDLVKQSTAPSDTPEGTWGLVHFEMGARANLPLGSATTPYVTASYGARALGARATFDDGDATDVSISGKYFGLGAGIERPITRSMSLDGGVDVGFGKFSHLKIGDEEESVSGMNQTRSIRMRLGVTWRPAARRTS